MTSALRREVFNLPNYLTMVRILAIPLVVWLLVQDSPLTNLIAVTIFLLAALTDMLDGYLARRMGLDSALGKLLDPLGDLAIQLLLEYENALSCFESLFHVQRQRIQTFFFWKQRARRGGNHPLVAPRHCSPETSFLEKRWKS